MLLKEAIHEYLLAVRQAGRSDATLYCYQWHLDRMAAWLEDQKGTTRLEDVTRSDLRTWGGGLRDRWSPATIRQATIAVRSLLRWCHEEGLTETNLAKALKVPKVKQRIQRTLSGEEIMTLISQCDTTSSIGKRNQALVALLADSGLRSAEVCRLRVCDLDLDNQRLQVIAKGGEEEVAYFGRVCRKYLTAWLDDREKLAAPGIQTVFVSIGGIIPGQPFTTSGLRVILRKLGQRAGVPGVSPHAFRRAFATQMVYNGASTRVVMETGRWDDIAMVQLYTRALRVQEMFQRYSPIDRLTRENLQPSLFDVTSSL